MPVGVDARLTSRCRRPPWFWAFLMVMRQAWWPWRPGLRVWHRNVAWMDVTLCDYVALFEQGRTMSTFLGKLASAENPKSCFNVSLSIGMCFQHGQFGDRVLSGRRKHKKKTDDKRIVREKHEDTIQCCLGIRCKNFHKNNFESLNQSFEVKCKHHCQSRMLAGRGRWNFLHFCSSKGYL